MFPAPICYELADHAEDVRRSEGTRLQQFQGRTILYATNDEVRLAQRFQSFLSLGWNLRVIAEHYREDLVIPGQRLQTGKINKI